MGRPYRKFCGRFAIVAAAGLVISQLSPAKAAVPYLISLQSPQVQQAWVEVEELVLENEKLDQPQPEPLLARAELWTKAGNHEEAVEDYLRATKLLMTNQPSLADQARALSKLQESLERLMNQPQPMYPSEAAEAFGEGVKLYEQRKWDEAAPYFAEATRLNNADPVYRTYRALALRRLGNEESANRQLATAVSILRRPTVLFGPNSPSNNVRVYHNRMERVQGPDRQWIQGGLSATTERQTASTDAMILLREQQASAK